MQRIALVVVSTMSDSQSSHLFTEVCPLHQEQMHDLSRGLEHVRLPVSNTEDENVPTTKYINRLVGLNGTSLKHLTYESGCECAGGICNTKSCACIRKWGGTHPGYTTFSQPESESNEIRNTVGSQRIGLEENKGNHPRFLCIYECGPACLCSSDCGNRLVQRGVQLSLETFMTAGKGWGVRSLQPISAGTFVCEYAGEVINTTESRRRQHTTYDRLGLNYLLSVRESVGGVLNKKSKRSRATNSYAAHNDKRMKSSADHENGNANLGEKSSNTVIYKYDIESDSGGESGSEVDESTPPSPIAYRTNIDATFMGNIGRYINHSCQPNLIKHIARHGLKVPSVALFSNRDLAVGEELTFSYGDDNRLRNNDGTKNGGCKDAVNTTTECRCGAEHCTGAMPFQADFL
eukprot:CFRG6612T1